MSGDDDVFGFCLFAFTMHIVHASMALKEQFMARIYICVNTWIYTCTWPLACWIAFTQLDFSSLLQLHLANLDYFSACLDFGILARNSFIREEIFTVDEPSRSRKNFLILNFKTKTICVGNKNQMTLVFNLIFLI